MGKNGCLSFKTQKGGVGQRDAKRGVKEGCRGGVKTHLFLDGCEFRERSTGAQVCGNKSGNPGSETTAIREL